MNRIDISLNTEEQNSLRDPQRKVGNIRTIAATSMFLGVFSFAYHVWSLVSILRNPEIIENTGQNDLVVYIGIGIMLVISLISLLVSSRLFQGVKLIQSNSKLVIRTVRSWRRWMACFLTFFIISLMILLLSNGTQSHQNAVQNYMGGTLVVICFIIYSLYYVGKFLDEMKPQTPTTGNIDITDLNNITP